MDISKPCWICYRHIVVCLITENNNKKSLAAVTLCFGFSNLKLWALLIF